MSLLLPLAAALVFSCERPSHHDGDAIRCAGMERSMRLYGIDAPEIPGACRPGRSCTPGDPYAARDHLRALTRGRNVRCEELDVDSYGRPVVRCTANGDDISCAMVASGHAVERYGRLNCGVTVQEPPSPEPLPTPEPEETNISQFNTAPIISQDGRYFAPPNAPVVKRSMGIASFAIGAWLMLINILGWSATDIDKARTRDADIRYRERGGPPRTGGGGLLLLALIGAGPGVLAAQQFLDHRVGEQPFSTLLLIIAGLQIGLILGAITLSMI